MSSRKTLEQNAEADPVLWDIPFDEQKPPVEPVFDSDDAEDVPWTKKQPAQVHPTDGVTHQGKSIVSSYH